MKVAERNEIISQTVARLQSIQTVDEYKASKKEIIDLMEKVFVSAIQVLKTFFDNMLILTPEEQKSESEKVQDDNFLLSPDIMKEFDRLENLPGGAEFSNAFSAEMQEIMSPHLEEFSEQMGKLMENFMGGLMGGMVDAMGAAFDAGSGEPETPQVKEFVWDYDNPDTLFILYSLYTSGSLSDLEQNKEFLIENIEMELRSKMFGLDDFFLPGYEDSWEDDKKKISEIQKLIERLVPEIEKEFTRISASNDSAEASVKIKEEMMERIVPAITELKEQVDLRIVEWDKKRL